MKIVTWNIYLKNKNIPKAIAFLKRQKADVMCLQEFPVRHLDALKALNWHVAICDELAVHKKHKKTDRAYTVIISRFPFRQHGIIAHKKRYAAAGRDRYAYFQADSSYVDIDAPEGLFRIFNAHFKCVAGPHHRLSQFKDLVLNLSRERHNIICGDFNTFAKPWVNILLWKFFGYRLREIPVNESKHLAKLLKTHGLKNPLRRQVTFWKFPVQLDYILVPTQMAVKAKRTFLRSYGSDHFPLLLEI